MTSTPKGSKHVQDSESTNSPLAGPGPGGHKPSFKSTKLAKRARSFKEDLLEKISQMRGPNVSGQSGGGGGGGGGGGRSQSPKGRGVATKCGDAMPPDPHYKNPMHELEVIAKQIQFALKHLRDVVSHQKLEVLPGNGTIILDTVWAINLSVKSIVSAENSTSVASATHQLFQSVAKLIKLCDETLIATETTHINEGHVDEVTKLVNDAVENLVQLVREKLKHQNLTYKTTPRTSYGAVNLELPAQRNSLPDIPLTPRERQILEQTSSGTPCTAVVRNSHSTESILRETSPPPKPPLPDGITFNNYRPEIGNSLTPPPPLPPKKRNTPQFQLLEEAFSSDNSLIASSLERISLHSKSPEDSSSLLSASAGSLDSMLNHSRDDDELIGMTEGELLDESNTSSCWEKNAFICNASGLTESFAPKRFSNADSGFGSLTSHRSSAISKRSSGSSHVSTTIQQCTKQSNVTTTTTTSSNNTEFVVKSESILQNLQSPIDCQFVKHSVQSFSHESSSSSSNVTTLHVGTDDLDNLLLDDDENGDDEDVDDDGDEVPPIPQKTKRRTERQPSPYDNVPDGAFDGELLVPCQMHLSQQSLTSSAGSCTGPQDNRPPLPPKKKHMFQSVAYSVMAYMEMFGNCSHGSDNEFTRHSVHLVQAHWAQPQSVATSPSPGLPTTQSCSFSHASHSSRSSFSQTQTLLIPSSNNDNGASPLQSPKSPVHTSSSSPSPSSLNSSHLPPALPPKKRIGSVKSMSPPSTPKSIINVTQPVVEMKGQVPDLLEHASANSNNNVASKGDEKPENDVEKDLMDELEIGKYLVYKKADEDGPEIRGGSIDALIIQATKATKNGAVTYQEAFLTTYRTFISPHDLILKLIRRYNYFYCQADRKPSREAFALMVRVVSELTPSDLDNSLQEKLMDFVQQLILNGEITLAKALRLKHIEKFESIQQNLTPHGPFIANITTRPARMFALLDFKSEQIAEQMTLLDAELFMKIEIPEVLIWAQEQNEERSPNLTRFTEHFNKMSFWARTMILKVDGKDREKYFLKFIKIMKHLRKINNFNSYLALLSALDSAPVRRLEWQKHVQEGLKEYCTLIDSSSSFRAYRQALAETQPPCIPYIGLVLQDLTFVHIGNSNALPDGSINFSKRWQQFNIVENMRKFKKCAYVFKKNERIISFFDNFDDHIGEDAMWQLSEKIKPRGTKKQTNNL